MKNINLEGRKIGAYTHTGEPSKLDLRRARMIGAKLSKADLGEMKAMKVPPTGVSLTAQALCLMFGVKPIKMAAPDGRGKVDNYWEPAKKDVREGSLQ